MRRCASRSTRILVAKRSCTREFAAQDRGFGLCRCYSTCGRFSCNADLTTDADRDPAVPQVDTTYRVRVGAAHQFQTMSLVGELDRGSWERAMDSSC
jgi:hypothetical protein